MITYMTGLRKQVLHPAPTEFCAQVQQIALCCTVATGVPTLNFIIIQSVVSAASFYSFMHHRIYGLCKFLLLMRRIGCGSLS